MFFHQQLLWNFCIWCLYASIFVWKSRLRWEPRVSWSTASWSTRCPTSSAPFAQSTSQRWHSGRTAGSTSRVKGPTLGSEERKPRWAAARYLTQYHRLLLYIVVYANTLPLGPGWSKLLPWLMVRAFIIKASGRNVINKLVVRCSIFIGEEVADRCQIHIE